MTLPEKVAYFDRSVQRDKKAIAWILNYREENKKQLEKYDLPDYERLLRFYRKALPWHIDLYSRYNKKYQATLLPKHYSAWMCIHRYEGAWDDSGGPYYGGLQMDLGFQQHYGATLLRNKGTADNWTPLEQMWVAEKAYQAGRGFYPWPNTARVCGLI